MAPLGLVLLSSMCYVHYVLQPTKQFKQLCLKTKDTLLVT